MCDSDSSSSLSEPVPSCSTHLDDLDPDVRDKFGRLAAVLRETNQNLVTFEFLLSHYRSLARVAPLPASPLAAVTPTQNVSARRAQGMENRVDSEEILDLLRSISQSVDGFREQLQEAATHRDENEDSVEETNELIEADGLGDGVTNLEALKQDRKLVEKEKEIIELKTALMKVEKELFEERQVAEVRADLTKQMEKKLDSERLAAKEMAKEIKYYVEKLSKLEARKENSNPQTVDAPCRVDQCVGTDGLNTPRRGVEKVDRCISTEIGVLDKLSDSFGKTVEKVDQCVGTVISHQQTSAAFSFCDKNEEKRLEYMLNRERGNNHILLTENEELREKLVESQRKGTAMEESRIRLKTKTRTLLKQYRAKRASVEKKDLQLSRLRVGLLHLRSLCENVECNYQVILQHLGAQIHVAARLMCLHLRHEDDVPAELPDKTAAGLGAWFQEVQAMASWMQTTVARMGVDGVARLGVDGVARMGLDGVARMGVDGVARMGVDGVARLGLDGVARLGVDGVARMGLDTRLTHLGVDGAVNQLELDTTRSTVYRRVRGEQDTQSEMSNGVLDQEAALEAVRMDQEAALEAVRMCEAGLNEQNTAVNSLIGCIDVP